MKALRRSLVAISLLLIAASLFATGSKESAAPAASAAQQVPTGPVTLTVAVKEDLAVADWENNGMTKYIEETLGVKLDFVTFPSKEIGTKLNLMAMDNAKGLPDILFHNAMDNEIASWANMGVIVPLTKYYEDEKLSANIRDSWKRIGVDYRGQVTSPDGEIYTIPSFNQSYGNEMPMKIFLYQPFLDALGLKVPTTTDELYEVLKKVVNGDPNGNGKKDEIGISGVSIGTNFASAPSGWFVSLMNSFVYAGGDQYLTLDEKGRVSAAYKTEQWKQGLAFIRKLVSEGLIQDTALTQNLTSFKAVMNSEDPAVFMFVWYTGDSMVDASSPRKNLYVGAAPFKGPQGQQYITYRPSIASSRMLISSNCKYPELAFQVGDLLSSELMGIVTRWGEKGVDWDYISEMPNPENYEGMYELAGFDKYIVVYDDATFWSSGNPQNKAFRQQGPYVRQFAIANGQAKPKGSFTAAEKMLAKFQFDLRQGGYAPEHTIAKLVYNSEESEIISEIKLTLKTYVDEYTSMVLDGQTDLDKTWNSFQKELKSIGLEDYISITQQVYDRMYGKK